MRALTVWAVAVALGGDAFSLAVGLGMGGARTREILRVSSTVALFHVLMPLAGLFLGSLLGRAVGDVASVVGALVLLLIGLQMLREARSRRAPAPRPVLKPLAARRPVTRGPLAVAVLAGSVSLDALSVGFGLGALRASLLYTVLVMGAVAGLMTALGFTLGRRVGGWLGQRAQLAGGLILLVIGLRMLLFR